MRGPIAKGRLLGALISLVIFLVPLLVTPAYAITDQLNPPPCNENPCVIQFDGGGYISSYEELSRRVRLTGWRIVIDGECYSACAILADRARPFVCLTYKARFFFHQMSGKIEGPAGNFTVYRQPYAHHGADVAAWIELNGGQPLSGWLYMPFTEARSFWPSCSEMKPENTTDD